ncbi:MAG: NAD(P)H-binding protein [Bacteroidota bacterium]
MEKYKKTIVVFGCTGTVGKLVLEKLLQEDCYVRGILRHPRRSYPVPLNRYDQLTYLSANLANPKEVEAACAFADAVFLLTATHPDQVTHETNVIDAAKKSGIQRLIKLSAPDIKPIDLVAVAKWHRKIEIHLEKSGMEYCCLRPQAFMQNWERNTFTIKKFGKFFGIMQDAPRNYIDARDVAETAVKFLLQKEPMSYKSVALAGPEAINHYEMAERLTRVTGRKIEYVNITKTKFIQILTKRAKLPLWLAHHIIELDELAVKIPEPNMDSTERFLNKKPRLMNAYLQEQKQVFAKEVLWKI